METWNSIGQLTKINNLLQIGLVIFGILVGVIGAASFIVVNRKGDLEKIEEKKFEQKVSNIDERTIEMSELADRNLTENQRAVFRKALQNTKAINVLAVRGNSKESQQYSKQIEDLLIEAGWSVEQFLPMNTFREISSSTIGINTNAIGLNEFEILKKTIEATGLKFRFDEFESKNIKQEIILDVGIIPANEYQTLLDKIN
jgi:ABC-type metal ion transport system substrate-binding protein